MSRPAPNPFRYGDLAFDEAFTDREAETRELRADVRNGQNVVLFAPRRYGKEKLAEKLASSIYEDMAPPVLRARDKVGSLFSGLRITPRILFDPNTGGVTFSFDLKLPEKINNPNSSCDAN